MAHQGPNAPSPFTDLVVVDTLLGEAMRQAITESLLQFLARTARLKQMADRFVKSDHLVQ